MEQELDLSKLDVHSDGYPYDWRDVLEFRDWTAVRALHLGSTTLTQNRSRLATLELNLLAACHGPTFDV